MPDRVFAQRTAALRRAASGSKGEDALERRGLTLGSGPLRPADVLHLQRTAGNRAVQDLGGHAIIVKQPDGGVSRQRKAAFLVLKGKASVSLASRPEAEMQALDGKSVTAVGTLRAPRAASARTVAQPRPLPALVDIQSVEPV